MLSYNKNLNTLVKSEKSDRREIVINKSMNKKAKSPFREITNTYRKVT